MRGLQGARVGVVVLGLMATVAAGDPWTPVPAAQWKAARADVAGLGKDLPVVVAYPAERVSGATCATAEALPPGLYELQFTVRPSHVANAIAFRSELRLRAKDVLRQSWEGQRFARVHQPETRTLLWVHRGGPLSLTLEAVTDSATAEQVFTKTFLKRGGPTLGDVDGGDDDGEGGLALDLDLTLDPGSAVYYLVDAVTYRRVSGSGYVEKVTRNKIRYAPGETLKGSATVVDVGPSKGSGQARSTGSGQGGEGTLNLYLEHGVKDRVKVKSLPVRLAAASQRIDFEITLPSVELGYALVAEYVSSDGADRSEAAEYFTIAANFNRVYISSGGGGGHGSTKADEARMRRAMEETVAGYGNASEHFAWAEDDMVEMSPETEYWFSGQTCYHMKKGGLQQWIRLAHEYGIAQISYAKFIMSGYLGWKTAYDYPNDHKGQYVYPVGMWEGVNVPVLDRFRNKEFAIYESTPGRNDNALFWVAWQSFMPINPDATPRMTRIAAEEVVRSAAMFGWDGIRWDGHPRGGGQCGGPGSYDAVAARRTQTLVRYFKDIVNAAYPNFGHGYNYLGIQKEPAYDWAYEDFELDELCRHGGLLMNESIGNATPGPYDYIARNLQVEGDLVRERGGYYLGISYAQGPRDHLVEGALWAAAGARSYNGVGGMETCRYFTRYAQYSLDERMRRLDRPGKILAPQVETRLWWQPFVYETPLENGRRQLVINFLNLPLKETRTPEENSDNPKYTMEPGTDPVVFALTLPDGLIATNVSLIDPYTLAVASAPLVDNRFEVPAIAIWKVAVIDLEAGPQAPSLAGLYGPPRTFGVPRPDRKAEPKPELVLDPGKDVWEVNKDMSALAPASAVKDRTDQGAFDALPPGEREARLLEIRAANTAEKFIAGWWKGGSLPADLKLKDKAFAFGDLAPRRNGRVDIYHGRGALDERARWPVVVAGLDRFSVHDAPLGGIFRAGGGHWLANAVPWSRFPEFDILLYSAIPHCAMGAENCYAMVDYVKAGGAVLFTGGEYAFGKGGYNYTVLERELLPVLCAETVDTRCSEAPLVIEPGRDFGDLKAAVDFAVKPCFWVWNQVALKNEPGVKVFLKSGNRPILVGWGVGKGRVACLLIDHRGKSEKDVTAFFDWKDWPALARAVIAWLAPDAGQVSPPPPPPVTAAEARTLLTELDAAGMEDVLDGMEKDAGTGGLLDDTLGGGGGSVEVSGEALKKRLAIIRQAVLSPGADVAAALAEQLAAVSTLPQETRYDIVDFIRANPPADLAETGRRCLASPESSIRGSGAQLLALAGDPGFARVMNSPDPTLETDPAGRGRDLALALATYGKPDLVDEGRRRVKAWNEKELQEKMRFTGGGDFSLAAPERPVVDKETLFQRAAWLAYLSRHDAATFGAQFAREWLMTAQYEAYCNISLANIWEDKEFSGAVKKQRTEDFRRLRVCLGRLRGLTQPDLEALIQAHPTLAAEGFCRANFNAEFRAAMNFLGSADPSTTRAILPALGPARNADLAAFAAARAEAGK